MERVLEPELMDDDEQARAYAESDFSGPHDAFVARFKRTFPSFSEGRVADLGCGNADPTIRLALAYPQARFVGFDGSQPMLSFGNSAIQAAGLAGRILLTRRILPDHGERRQSYDVVISNSLLHQLHHPEVLWQSTIELAKPGAHIFVMDLTRPPTIEAAEGLVALHTQTSDPELMKRDFYNSLRAALRPEEVRLQLDALGLGGLHVEVVSDRHMIIWGTAP